MKNQDYINERMEEFAMNIDEFFIGQTVEDFDKSHCEITNKTLNTIEVLIKRKRVTFVSSFCLDLDL
jgi:hypothetical protein